jgi:mRNA deadenylase 3'-5' endonuclease subunit Ccr4
MALSHRIMSLNINGAYNDGDNSWEKRAPLTFSIINRYKPDLIGFQECAKGNLAAFHKHLSDYHVVEGNCYGDTPPQERSSILFMTLFLHENVQTEAVSIQFEHFDANRGHSHSDFGP